MSRGPYPDAAGAATVRWRPGAALLRLTLRSARDGRLLARVIEREGTAFVLDFGDARTVAEASRLVLHGGFTVHWQDRPETAVPGSPSLVRQLALYYAARGYLVFVDEPDFPRRPATSPSDAPSKAGGPPTLLPDEWSGGEIDTEILSREDLKRRARAAAAAAETEEADPDWDDTEEVPRS